MKVVPTFHEELDKVLALDGDNDTIGQFLEWLPSIGLMVCEVDPEEGYYMTYKSIPRLLAMYFNIDEVGFANEKAMTYRYVRWMQTQENYS